MNSKPTVTGVFSADYRDGLDKLRGLLAEARKNDEVFKEITGDRDAVLDRFGPVFASKAIKRLSEEQFRSFLIFENNRHWSGLHRQSNRICADLNRLRRALSVMLDESRPVAERLNEMGSAVPGMGRAIITGILLVAYPGKYGVWNNTSEGALRALRLWPNFDRGTNFGDRYAALNEVLKRLAADLEVDLWTLDALFWRVETEETSEPSVAGKEEETDVAQRFGIERHLHEFLRDNWAKTDLGRDWVLYSEENEPELGYEYPTDIGCIDLLAKHKKEKRWLVVELKRGQGADDTVGQVLRYIGWIRKHLADKDESVEGLIIAHEQDEKLMYALSAVSNVKLLLYEVSFRLVEPKK